MIRTMLSVACIFTVLALVAFVLHALWVGAGGLSLPFLDTVVGTETGADSRKKEKTGKNEHDNTPVLMAYQNGKFLSYVALTDQEKVYRIGRSRENDLKISEFYSHNHRLEFELWRHGSEYFFRTKHKNLRLLNESMKRIQNDKTYILKPHAEIHSANITYVIGRKKDVPNKHIFFEPPTRT